MSVLTITERVAQARPGEIPCRTNESDLWFSDTATDISKAQAMCRACPLVAECLAGAIERNEPWGIWGGELFERGQVVAQKKPKGRPRKDAAEIAAAAEQRLNRRLEEVSSLVGAA